MRILERFSNKALHRQCQCVHTLEDLLELFRRPTFIIYFSILAVVVVICLNHAISRIEDGCSLRITTAEVYISLEVVRCRHDTHHVFERSVLLYIQFADCSSMFVPSRIFHFAFRHVEVQNVGVVALSALSSLIRKYRVQRCRKTDDSEFS